MANQRTTKHNWLKQAGLLNPQRQRVRERLFQQHPEFFDAYDLFQVRYELLRAHLVESENVVALCARYGVSRQTFYNLWEKFLERGSAGLIPGKPGPKGASKLTMDVVAFARGELEKDADLSGAGLAAAIEARFRTSLHKRTLERLLRDLRSKKKEVSTQ